MASNHTLPLILLFVVACSDGSSLTGNSASSAKSTKKKVETSAEVEKTPPGDEDKDEGKGSPAASGSTSGSGSKVQTETRTLRIDAAATAFVGATLELKAFLIDGKTETEISKKVEWTWPEGFVFERFETAKESVTGALFRGGLAGAFKVVANYDGIESPPHEVVFADEAVPVVAPAAQTPNPPAAPHVAFEAVVSVCSGQTNLAAAAQDVLSRPLASFQQYCDKIRPGYVIAAFGMAQACYVSEIALDCDQLTLCRMTVNCQ